MPSALSFLEARKSAALPRRGVLALVLAVVLVLAACSSDDGGTTVAADGEGTQAPGDGQATETSATEPEEEPCDTSFNPTGYYEDAELAGTLGEDHAGMDMDESSTTMNHSEMDDGDEPMDMSGGLGEVEAAAVVVELSQLDEAGYDQWLESLDPSRDVAAPDDTGRGGHLGPQTWTHITDDATCQQLADELDIARSVAAEFPKASDALAAGYIRVAPYLPGIASHWMNFRLVDDEFDVAQPEMLLYDGNEDDSSLVGLSYFIRASGDAEPEVGFTGNNDHYHRHEGLCVGDEGVIGDSTMSAEECEAIGGRKADGGSGWMSHAWIVEGCESPWGVFSAQNPLLDQSLGESSGDGEPCSGSEVASRWDLSPAESE